MEIYIGIGRKVSILVDCLEIGIEIRGVLRIRAVLMIESRILI